MNDIQQQIQNYEQSHQIATRAFIAIGILLVLVLVFFHFYGHTPIQIKQDQSAVYAALDSLRVESKVLRTLHTGDSIRLSVMQDQLDETQNQLDNINKRYAAQRTTLDHSTIDTRLGFFANHLPQGSNSGH